MKAIQFGAGNIGRGFIGAVLEQGGYHVVFADVNQVVIDRINLDKKYTVHVMDVECVDQIITNISGVNSTTPQIIEEIADSDTQLITTAVGVVILPRIAPSIAKGIVARMNAGIEKPLNIIACENAVRATSQLKEHVLALLNDEQKEYCLKHVGFIDCSVDRIVPPVRSENPIDVVVENYYEWNVEEDSFVGPVPHIKGMNLAKNLIAYIERKLFTLNTGHAITAYMGKMKGYATIDQAIADPVIYSTVKAAMQESGLGLIKKYGFDHDTHFAYIEKIIKRFKNPYLKDDVTRVGREPLRKLSASDRLIKPLLTAIEAEVEVKALYLGIGAALHYYNMEDPQSVELQSLIKDNGLKVAIEKLTGIAQTNPIASKIENAYSEIVTIVK
ncbi:MAG: mannitol-1-phosphate 5-dehydrogenase [Alistipes sp.]|nr:mannitol-1-phosphate 5-dehydrogenase [Candidatus Alistipes equi]